MSDGPRAPNMTIEQAIRQLDVLSPVSFLLVMSGARTCRLRRITPEASRTQCSKCGRQIPPGRVGRQCTTCRGTNLSPETSP
jgi:hypothetical protein